MNQVGTASDFGRQWIIGRSPEQDQLLYQTERYHHSTFGYDIPVPGDGDYVLVMMFAEVYFNEPRKKVRGWNRWSRRLCSFLDDHRDNRRFIGKPSSSPGAD